MVAGITVDWECLTDDVADAGEARVDHAALHVRSAERPGAASSGVNPTSRHRLNAQRGEEGRRNGDGLQPLRLAPEQGWN